MIHELRLSHLSKEKHFTYLNRIMIYQDPKYVHHMLRNLKYKQKISNITIDPRLLDQTGLTSNVKAKENTPNQKRR